MSKKMKRTTVLSALIAVALSGTVMVADAEAARHVNTSGTADTPIVVNGETFDGYSGVSAGGAVHNTGVLQITDSTFSNNKVSSTGGAIWNSGTLTVTGSSFTDNQAVSSTGRSYGGAITNQGTLVVDDCYFKGNTTSGKKTPYGTVIYTSNGNTTIKNSIFEGNNGAGNGLVYAAGNSTLTIENTQFLDNDRACITVTAASKLILKGENTFAGNTSNDALIRGDVTFAEGSETTFSNNDAPNLGVYDTGNLVMEKGSKLTSDGGILAMEGSKFTVNDATIELGGDSEIAELSGSGANIILDMTEDGTIAELVVGNYQGTDTDISGTSSVSDYLAANGDAAVAEFAKNAVDANGKVIDDMITTEEGILGGAFNITQNDDGSVNATQAVNSKSDAVSNAGMNLKAHFRAHMNDMNKRMGELRMANGEAGVWARMVRGEYEYQGAKSQHNQYQFGYDKKLANDDRWTVGAALTISEGDGGYGQGYTEEDSKAIALYGSKLNKDGSFVDLIARYIRMDSDVTDSVYGSGDYDTNGYSFSAEVGKRIEQNGFWVEPQAELTYGTIRSTSMLLGNRYRANFDSMDSLIARLGFSLGKDIKQGNVYARASYLYDFDGESATQFDGGKAIAEDLGGGWWEVGVGANVKLSDATYVYADVEKTFGGEIDTNWQWNLGVRYSF